MIKAPTEIICVDANYSTTRLVTREQPIIKNKPEDQFESVLFLPVSENRQGEGGLRTQGYFKQSYPDKPLISIITVVFNGEKYLEETIQSVINQSYDNVEYIIIDGGSTDGTLDIIKKYESQIDYWVSEGDEGIYDAMNKGMGISTGDYLLFLGSDDTLRNNLLEISRYMLCSDTIYYGNVYCIKSEKIYNGKYNKYKIMLSNICHQSIFYPMGVYKKHKYNLKYLILSDYNMNICLMNTYHFKYVNFIVSNYNDGEGVSSNFKDDNFDTDKLILFKENLPAIYFYIYLCREFLKNLIKGLL